jgi:DNA-directed RNA polymerase specialized sigma24 family protein
MFSELDYAAIGAVLGIPAGTVGSRRNEALARLRELLAARGHESSRSAS